MPKHVIPILVTDAGFRSDWLRGVEALGWDYIGRLRNNTRVRASPEHDWHACVSLHSSATATARDLGEHLIVKGSPLPCRLVLAQRARKGRDQLTRQKQPEQGRTARKARKATREPWLLVTSLSGQTATAHQIVTGYSKRMQIEEAFRDLKSHRYGAAFEDSLSRKPERLAILLLLHALASFAAWLMGLAARVGNAPDPMTRQRTHHRRYSLMRRGLEWLRRSTVPPEIYQWLRHRRLDSVLARNATIGL